MANRPPGRSWAVAWPSRRARETAPASDPATQIIPVAPAHPVPARSPAGVDQHGAPPDPVAAGTGSGPTAGPHEHTWIIPTRPSAPGGPARPRVQAGPAPALATQKFQPPEETAAIFVDNSGRRSRALRRLAYLLVALALLLLVLFWLVQGLDAAGLAG